jgi:Holliday junction DNA helicase RuvA
MIGWLSGIVRQLDPVGIVLLDTGGVGYEIHLSLQTLCRLQADAKAELFIHTHVREDQITLFGFTSPKERTLFRRLTTVSGIGARLGLNLMSGMPIDELVRAIERADDAAIARTPGIGKKTAQRLILELQGKLEMPDAAGLPAQSADNASEDVRSALINLGYRPAQIDPAIAQAGTHADFESLFRAVLKAMG